MKREEADDQSLLALRARELAAPIARASSGLAAARELVGLTVGLDRFAIPFDHVREIARTSAVMPLPGAPAHMVGVARIRGRLVALLDLARMFDPQRSVAATAAQPLFVAVCGPPEDELGLVADAIGSLSGEAEVSALEASEENAPVVGTLPDGTLLLDIDRLLGDPRTSASHTSAGNIP